jgi:hypothetical protein
MGGVWGELWLVRCGACRGLDAWERLLDLVMKTKPLEVKIRDAEFCPRSNLEMMPFMTTDTLLLALTSVLVSSSSEHLTGVDWFTLDSIRHPSLEPSTSHFVVSSFSHRRSISLLHLKCLMYSLQP